MPIHNSLDKKMKREKTEAKGSETVCRETTSKHCQWH